MGGATKAISQSFSLNAITDYSRGLVTAATHPFDLSKGSILGQPKEGNPLYKEVGGKGGTPAKAFSDPMGLFGDGGDPLWAKVGIGTDPKVPDVVEQDPIGDAEEAKRTASRSTSAKRALASKRRSSLLGSAAPSLLRSGRGTLG